MDRWVVSLFRRHARRLKPYPTGLAERLAVPERVEAVVFDIYGTLLISGCGEIGVESHGTAPVVGDAFRAVGLQETIDEQAVVESFQGAIERHHGRAGDRGIPFPEVDIVAVWREVVEELVGTGKLPRRALEIDCRRLAVEYEVRANPVWPMPGAVEALDGLRRAGIRLGIVSNAQFFTPAIFPALFGATLEALGIPLERQIYSYRYGRAKPDRHLFQQIEKELTGQGIGADRTIYVGNDMRNDIWPAAAIGMRTALFAGDRRSLRMRRDDPDVAVTRPDLVVTEWRRFTEAVLSAG